MPNTTKRISIVVLACNREEIVLQNLRELQQIDYANLEIILVDNSTEIDMSLSLQQSFPDVIYLKQSENIGVGARNAGISFATGEFVVTLDDDVLGITKKHLLELLHQFEADQRLAAICFKVIDPTTKNIINWCHHYRVEDYHDQTFLTDEISEGAVIFRKAALLESGLYAAYFFISHEGHDLAIRLMNKGFKIIYWPGVEVLHYHSNLNRTPWRRYYYDTRNAIWLAIRNYPFWPGVLYLARSLGSMFIYACRDNFLGYWFKGIRDGIKGSKKAFHDRIQMTNETYDAIKLINKNRPSLWYITKKRLLQRQVKI